MSIQASDDVKRLNPHVWPSTPRGRKKRNGGHSTGILERDIQKSILDYLQADYRVVFSRRFNAGTIYIDGRAMKMGERGDSDIIGMLFDGRFLAIEVKRPGEVPTPEQHAFLNMVNDNGGVAFIATSVEDVQEWFGEMI